MMMVVMTFARLIVTLCSLCLGPMSLFFLPPRCRFILDHTSSFITFLGRPWQTDGGGGGSGGSEDGLVVTIANDQ